MAKSQHFALLKFDVLNVVVLKRAIALGDRSPIYPPRWAITKSIGLAITADLYSTTTFSFCDHNALQAFISHIGPTNASYLRKLKLIAHFPVLDDSSPIFFQHPTIVLQNCRVRLKALSDHKVDVLGAYPSTLQQLRDLKILKIEVDASTDNEVETRYKARRYFSSYHSIPNMMGHAEFISALDQLLAISKRKRNDIGSSLHQKLVECFPDCRVDLKLLE
jgi:hypothetical protein